MAIVSPHKQKYWRLYKPDYSNGALKLEIGCGVKQIKKKQGYVGLDIEDFGQEMLWDVDNGIPLPDNSCQEIFMHHVLEHVKNPIYVLNECWRVLAEKGTVEIIVPYYKEPEAYVLHHTHFYSEDTFKHLTLGGMDDRYGIKPWKEIEILVGAPYWKSDFKQDTVYAKLQVKK